VIGATPDTYATREPAITRRAVVVGLIGTAVLAVVTPWSDLYLAGIGLANCHLPVGAFVLMVVWAGAANVLLTRLSPRLGMTRREVLVSYLVMLAASGIPSLGLTDYLLPSLAGAFYFETPENEWQALFFRYIPQWFVPVDLRSYPAVAGAVRASWVYSIYALLPAWLQPADPEIITHFYEALPGAEDLGAAALVRAIPWGAWLVPMLAWTGMAFTLFFIFACITVILRAQWVERERLSLTASPLPAATGSSYSEVIRGVASSGAAERREGNASPRPAHTQPTADPHATGNEGAPYLRQSRNRGPGRRLPLPRGRGIQQRRGVDSHQRFDRGARSEKSADPGRRRAYRRGKAQPHTRGLPYKSSALALATVLGWKEKAGWIR